MGGGSEAVESEALAGLDAAQAVGTVSDDSGAEQWGGVFVGEYFRDAIRVILVDDGVVGVAAVDVESGELGVVAKILQAATAIVALVVGGVQPGDADAISFLENLGAAADGVHNSYNLVAGDYRKFR